MTDNPAPRPDGAPLDARRVTFVDLRAEIDNQRTRYEAWRTRNAAANSTCHSLPMLDRYVEIYTALDRLVERVSGDAVILDRLREIAAAERAAND